MPDVEALLGRTFTVNATLKVGAVSEAVQVTAEAAPLVDTRSTMIAHNVTSEEIDRMPKGRSFQSVAVTAPSVNQGEIEGGLQVNGASGSENQFTIDGVATNSLLNGQSRQDTVFEYLQEVQVKTVGITAEFGGALGGVISAVTKSGGNRFTGEGHYYYLGSGLSGSPVPRLVISPIDDRTVFTVEEPKQPNHHNEIGGSLGGPIMRDKLFFFGSLSPRFASTTREYLFSSGTDAGEIARDQTRMNAYGKVSYGSRRVNAYFGMLLTPTTSEGTLPAYNGIGPKYLSSSKAANNVNLERGYEIDQRNFTGNVDLHVSGSSFVRVQAGHFYDNYKDIGIPLTTPIWYRTPSSLAPNVPAQFAGPTDFTNTPAVNIVDHDTTKQTYFQADYNAAFSAAGYHTLKAGAGMRRNSNDVDKRYPGGRVSVWWGQTFQSSVPGVGTGTGPYGYYEVDDLGTFGETHGDIAHFYMQDQWSAGNLTLNLGVRFEQEKIPAFRERETAIEFGWGEKFAPRIGAAYDFFGDGRMKVFGSYGRYYDWTKYELARGTFGGDLWQTYYRSFDDPALLSSININNLPGRDLLGAALGYTDWRIPAFTEDVLDPDMKPMSQDSYSGGVEYQVGRSTVLSVNYIHNNLIRTIEDVGQLIDGSEVYTYGNPGEGLVEAAFVSTATTPFNVPRPKRVYDALQVSLNRRFSNNWFLAGNYTLSRLYGNYAGLASSDEIRTPGNSSFAVDQQQGAGTARPGGSATRSFDLDEMMWDANGNLDVTGRLATDRPHVFKVYGAYMTPFGTQIGLNQYIGSGTPLTTEVRTLHTIAFPEGRGDMGRTPALALTDLLLSHEIRMRGSDRIRFELNVINLFNQKTVRHQFVGLNRNRGAAAADLHEINLADGYDYRARINASPNGPVNGYDPRYNMPDLWNEGTQGHFMVKFLF